MEVPRVVCQRVGCAHYTEPADARLLRPYGSHQSPSKRDLETAVKQASRVRWREEYGPKAEAEVAEKCALAGDEDEDSVRAAVYERLETEVRDLVQDCVVIY